MSWRTANPTRRASLLGVSTDAVRAKAQAARRRLSQSLYDQTTFDGILYMSRITNRQCVAVYDRAVAANLQADRPALDLPRLAGLQAILDTLHITIEAGACARASPEPARW